MSTFNPLDHPICFARPLRADSVSAWLEHVPFGMLLVQLVRPRVLVELGTHTGISYCAFCQAVKDAALDTKCYAVDTWEGDPHAGFYGPEVLSELRTYHDPMYGAFSSLLQSTFDEAVSHFAKSSIDLLHIDGLHTYEAVKHDYETWLPKLSDRAVVVFHDTNVREGDFGVWRFWEELKQQHPHFEFAHGHGLGVVRVGRKIIPALDPILDAPEEEAQRLRAFFFAMGSRISMESAKDARIAASQAELADMQRHAQELSVQVADREKAVASLTDHSQVLSGQVADRERAVREARDELARLSAQSEEREAELGAQVEAREQAVAELTTTVADLQAGLTLWQREVEAFQKDREERIKIAAVLDQQIQALKDQLGALQSAAGFRILALYRSAVERLLPAGSIRRILYDRTSNALRGLLVREASRRVAPSERQRPPLFVPRTRQSFPEKTQPIKLIAFYRSPRTFSLADAGGGETPAAAWDTMAKTTPQFAGHRQPHLPGELGTYDPMSPRIWRQQVELARQYGIHAFCFEFHWPSEFPIDGEYFRRLASNPPRGFPFCLCWHSEIGVAGREGLQEDISASGTGSDEKAAAFIRFVRSALRRKNYLRIDGRPVLVVDNVQFLSEIAHLARGWRKEARELGIGELYLVATQALGPLEPDEIGFDAVLALPPGGIELHDISDAQTILNPFYFGRVYRYTDVWRATAEAGQSQTYKRLGAVLTDWDDHAQLPGQGSSLILSSPLSYRNWLTQAGRETLATGDADKSPIFVNAWNAWLDGAYLEPDGRRGYAYLQATAEAMRELARPSLADIPARGTDLPAPDELVKRHDTAVIMHLYYPDMWPEMRAYLKNLGLEFDLYVSIPRTVIFPTNQILVEFPQATIFRCDNRGRDIAPFLAALAAIYSLGYKYVCKIHTKKSPHREDGEEWRQDMLQKILGSAAVVDAAKHVLDTEADVGLVGPKGHVLPGSTNWEPNAPLVRQLSDEADVPWNGSEFQFVGGSMFWFRPEALYPLTTMGLTHHDFDPEQGQLDGTLAHALERFVGLIAIRSGFRIVEIDEEMAAAIQPPPVSTALPEDIPPLKLDPIIVYQMGRVGSVTVYESLVRTYQSLGQEVDIHHIHVLDNLDWIEERMQEYLTKPDDSIGHINLARELRTEIDAESDGSWRLVTLVRDPVARNVSTFFHNLGEEIPDWQDRLARGDLDVAYLQQVFLETRHIHESPKNWFDNQMKTVFGIDVFASPFPHDAGYRIYNVHWSAENPITRSMPVPRRLRRTPLLVIRLEDLNRCARRAMREFLGLQDFRLQNANIGEDKAYADVYRAFKREPLPLQYVEAVLSTQFARHFYTASEIAGFTKQWTSALEVAQGAPPS